jgi:hypothetical protein
MKKMTMSVYMIACALMLVAQSLFAANAPADLKFLSSRASLRAFAGEQSRYANMNMYSKGFAYNDSIGLGWSWDTPYTMPQIREELGRWQYAVSLINPADRIRVNGNIYNAEGDMMFQSYDSYITPELISEKGGAEYRIPRPYLSFRMADRIPFRLDKSIKWARVSFLGEDGQTVFVADLETDGNGKFWINPNLAGAGMVELHDNVGATYVYDLHQGGIRTEMYGAQFDGPYAWVDGMYSFENPDNITFTIYSWRGQGENPTFEINMTEKSNVGLSLKTREGALPIGYNIRKQGDALQEWQSVVVPKESAGAINVPLGPGVYYIVPIWNPEEFRESVYWGEKGGTPVVNGGGGGIG